MSDPSANTDYQFSQPVGLWERRGACGSFIQLATSDQFDIHSINNIHADEEGFHVWHYWAQGPKPEVLWEALRTQIGASLDMHCAHNNEHPLYRLLLRNKTLAARKWLSQAKSPNQPAEPHDTYWHAIAWSGEHNSLDDLSDCLCVQDLNRQDAHGLTPAVIAVHRGDIDFVKKFLFLGVDPDIPDTQKRVLLHHVAQYGDIDFYTQIQDLGAVDNTKNDRGLTPMDILRDRMKHGTQTDLETLRLHWQRRYFQKTIF